MNRLTDIYLGNTHSQIIYDPLGHKTNMLWENITHISGIANPHIQPQRIANPLERGKVITPMIEEGLNPELMIYQPYK